ncbi:hypothetical protein P4C99_12635 [Pontiellaceae bacterium B1224]|nr:hypothetical protein [Pontiellaceae bacterium B1224]
MNKKYAALVLFAATCAVSYATVSWPAEIIWATNTATVFPPQPNRISDQILFSRSAISVHYATQTTTVHGVAFMLSNITSNESTLALNNFHFQNIEMPDLPADRKQELLAQLNKEAATWNQDIAPEALDIMLKLAGSSAESNEQHKDAPKTTSVSRDDSSLTVSYLGDVPNFIPIQGTNLEFAENSAFQVLKEANIYFCADRGVWYAATSPFGPWNPTDRVPRQVQRIPPSHPMYNTRFLYVGTQGQNTISYGFYPGYLGGRNIWGRLGNWGIDYQSPDYSIQVDPFNGSLIYRGDSRIQTTTKQKNWGRDYSKFPEFEN